MNLLVTEHRHSAATLPQTPWKRWRIKTSHVKYGLFFFMIFMMITAVKVYLNYANINQNIIDVKEKIVQRQKDMQYLEIQNAYYHSPYAGVIVAHQQGILLPGEQFVLFERIDPNALLASGALVGTSGTTQKTGTGGSLSPSSAWKDYFMKKFDRIP